MVLVHICAHPPLFVAHSLISNIMQQYYLIMNAKILTCTCSAISIDYITRHTCAHVTSNRIDACLGTISIIGHTLIDICEKEQNY